MDGWGLHLGEVLWLLLIWIWQGHIQIIVMEKAETFMATSETKTIALQFHESL